MKQTTFEQAAAMQSEIKTLIDHIDRLQRELKHDNLTMKVGCVYLLPERYDTVEIITVYINGLEMRIATLQSQFDKLQDEQDEQAATQQPERIVFPEGGKYVCVWNHLSLTDFANCKIVTSDFFNDDNGYEREDIKRIAALKQGENVEFEFDDHIVFCV